MYYLEDAIELIHFVAPPRDKKKNLYDDENLNAVCDTITYSLTTQQSMGLINEDIPFELIVELLLYFHTFNVEGVC